MTRGQLTEILLDRHSDLDEEEIKTIIDELFSLIGTALVADEPVSIRGFGRFDVVEGASKRRRNPGSGKVEVMSGKKRVKFTCSSKMQRRLT